jgi:CHAT domain-containing protein
MVELHRQLVRNRLSVAEALRNARRKLREDARYRNPFYWASFVVIDSGRELPQR